MTPNDAWYLELISKPVRNEEVDSSILFSSTKQTA